MRTDRRHRFICSTLVLAAWLLAWPEVSGQSQFRLATDLVRV